MRFIIWTPPWTYVSAGIQVLHKLCHQLNEIGCEAFVTSPGKPGWYNPQFDGLVRPSDYVIYPDIVADNPLKAKQVIRYMLYYPRVRFHGRVVPKNELMVYYSGTFYPDCAESYERPLPESNMLEISITEPEIFQEDLEVEKDLVLYYVSKCNHEQVKTFNLPHNAQLITWGTSRRDLAKLLQRTRKLYCFDVNSTLGIDAHLCGAEVYLITMDSKVIRWRGPTAYENRVDYYDLERIKRFVHLAKTFDYGENK